MTIDHRPVTGSAIAHPTSTVPVETGNVTGTVECSGVNKVKCELTGLDS